MGNMVVVGLMGCREEDGELKGFVGHKVQVAQGQVV